MTVAPLGARVRAWLLDLLITPILPIALYLGLGALYHPNDIPSPVGAPIASALLIFHLLYAPLLLRRTGPHAGQTLGKQATGVRVVESHQGGPVSLPRGLTREVLGRSLLAFIPLYFIADHTLPFLGNRTRRAIHDIIARTVVLDARAGGAL